jgi:hypothetical protein
MGAEGTPIPVAADCVLRIPHHMLFAHDGTEAIFKTIGIGFPLEA